MFIQAANAGIKTDVYTAYADQQIGYMLGDSGRSFVVGFGSNYPLQPHHKAAACASPPAECTWSTFGDTSTNNPHQLNGALVGGPKYANDQFQDIRTDYIMNEVTLDYNAGFQSAVAGLKARACGSNTTAEPTQTQPTGATSETTTSMSTSGSEQPTTQATGSQTTNEISSTSSSITESTTSSSTSCSAERYDYGEVLRLSNLFYEAQRSGDLPDNNRVPWRGDSSTDDRGNNGEDLSGGYHDGGYIYDY